jgi:hypothetical protein
VIAAEMEEVGDLVVGGKETLCLPRRLETLHLPFSSSHWLVRILGPVVEALVLAVLDPGYHLPLGRPIAREPVGDYDPLHPALPLQQLAQQALGGPLIASALHQHVEYHPGLVHITPEPVLHTNDLDRGLVEVPLVSSMGQPSPDPIGELLAELERPLPHGLVADDDAVC